ncbi:glutamine amidotransferase-related protein [Clostridium sp. WILCCON 0269]|uniref:CTP synthase (glutamine hydrolyzing) n=1 Tax=Candidatus Clostridium eludens TaxID=3381663 RepID=A0ABW8SIW1_9CLOT
MNTLIKIGIIGDFNGESPTHKATNEVLKYCADYIDTDLEIQWLPTESLENDVEVVVNKDGLWCAPGSPYNSMEGALNAIKFARENNYPFIGTCGGFQHVILEYARNVLNFKDAQHAEYDPYASKLFISALTCSLVGKILKIFIDKNSKTYGFYNKTEIEEHYYCNFGLNTEYEKLIDEGGLKVVGTDELHEARIVELPENNFFVATLFVPQLNSSPEIPHKLIIEFLRSAKEFHLSRK